MFECELTRDSIKNVQILQKKRGYRFSIDPLLIANFINLEYSKKIADFGSGSGIIGLLLAKKYPLAHVELFELQEDLFNLSKKNISINRLDENVEAHNLDIRNIRNIKSMENSYSLVVSNPPYRKPTAGKLSPYDERQAARHETSLTLPELIDAAFYALRGKGRFTLIYHPSRFLEVLGELQKKRLEPRRVQFIHSNINSDAKMFLIEAIKEGKTDFNLEKPFFLYNEFGSYTEEAKIALGV